MFVSDTVAFWLGTAGICAIVVGVRRIGMAMLALSVIHWVVWPGLWSLAAELPLWVKIMAVPLILLAIILVALRLLQWVVEGTFGPEAAGFLAGTYLVRMLDAAGRGLLRLTAPLAPRQDRGRSNRRRRP